MNCKFVIETKLFSTIIKSIAAITEEVPFMITQEGIIFETLDPSHVACMFLKIPKEEMVEWKVDCVNYHKFILDISDLPSFIKGKEKGLTVVTITGEDQEDEWKKRWQTCIACYKSKTFDEITEDGIKYSICENCGDKVEMDRFKVYHDIKVNIKIVSPEGSATEIALEGDNNKYLPLKYPNIEYTGAVTISKKEMLSVITNLKKCGEEVTITLKDDIICFEGHEKFKAMYSKADPLIKEIKGEAVSQYNLCYLGDIIKGIDSKEVEFNLKNDAPIEIRDLKLDLGYVLAPRIER
jgi:hypothetical protein